MADTNIDLLYLSEPDTIAAGVTNIGDCIDVMAETLRLFSIGDYRMGGPLGTAQGLNLSFPNESAFPRMPLNGPDRRFAAMPAYLGGDIHLAGVKWYGSNVANKGAGLPRSIHTVILSDADTGAPKAIMAGNLVSAYRTAAVPGVGAKYLSSPEARVAAIVGPGAMNRTSLESFLSARPGIDEVRVLGRSATSTEAYVAEVRAKHPELLVEIVDTMQAAVRDADLVSVATVSAAGLDNYPYLDEGWLKPGAFVSLPANIRLDEDFVVERANRVVDSRGIFEAWADNLQAPTHERMGFVGMNFIDLVRSEKLARDDISEIGQIIAGERPGRLDEQRIHLFGFGGLPVEDVAWGARVYRNALERGIGTTLNFWPAPALA